MQGKIALEEHYAIEDTLQDSNGYLPPETWEELSGRLMDIEGRRIDEMDQNGVEMMILSLNAPAVQAIYDRERANEIARKSNDMLAEWVERNPGRFRGFAALPLQDVDMACVEMERCVKELGFRVRLLQRVWPAREPFHASPTLPVSIYGVPSAKT